VVPGKVTGGPLGRNGSISFLVASDATCWDTSELKFWQSTPFSSIQFPTFPQGSIHNESNSHHGPKFAQSPEDFADPGMAA